MKRQGLGVLVLLVVASGFAWSRVASADPLLPDFAAAVFDESLDIDNPYFPLVPGTKYHYLSEPAPGEPGDVENILVEALPDTKTISGVETRVVHDRVWVEDRLIEDTLDWYAQDNAGNVWYLGEYVTNYLFDAGGMPIGTSNDGSWETGVDGALPGYIMEASPTVGHNYSQEYYEGTAEDEAEVLALNEIVSIPLGVFTNVVRTEDTTELDPDLLEHKFYASGFGLIREYDLDPDTEEIVATTTLASITPEPSAMVLAGLGAAWLLLLSANRHSPCRGRDLIPPDRHST